jgi:hypothetical protein
VRGKLPCHAVITEITRAAVDVAVETCCSSAFAELCIAIDASNADDIASMEKAAEALRTFNFDALEGDCRRAFADSKLHASMESLPACFPHGHPGSLARLASKSTYAGGRWPWNLKPKPRFCAK